MGSLRKKLQEKTDWNDLPVLQYRQTIVDAVKKSQVGGSDACWLTC